MSAILEQETALAVASDGDHLDKESMGSEDEAETMRDELETLKAEQTYAEFKAVVGQQSVDIAELKAMAAIKAANGEEDADEDPEWQPENDEDDVEESVVEDVSAIDGEEAKEPDNTEDQEDEDDDDEVEEDEESDLSDVDETEDEAVKKELADRGELSDVQVPGVMKKEYQKRFPAMWRTGRNLERADAEDLALEKAQQAGEELPDEGDLDPDYEPGELIPADEEGKPAEDKVAMDSDDEEFVANNPLDPTEVYAEAAVLADESKMEEDLTTMVKALEIADNEEDMNDAEVVVLTEAITSFDESSYDETSDPDYMPVVGDGEEIEGNLAAGTESESDSDEDKMDESEGCDDEEPMNDQ